MIKRIGVLLLMAGSLLAYEDVSFSARTLGLGGDHAAVADDAFASIVNPALAGRTERSTTGLSYGIGNGYPFYVLNFIQPIKGGGTVGGNLFYRSSTGITSGDHLTETDTRFFLAIPIGKSFSLGTSLGANSQEYFSESGGFPLPRERFAPGPMAGIGGTFRISKATIGISVSEWWPERSPLVRGAMAWRPAFAKLSLVSSSVLVADAAIKDGTFKLHGGGELFLFNDCLGFRAGFRYGSDSLSGFSPTFGGSVRTHREEKTDIELHYGMVLIDLTTEGSAPLHQLSLAVLIGDARKAEKDSIKIAQAERARKLREQALARERDKLRAELDAIEQERSALEREREDIERLRHEALAALGRLRGVEFAENDTFIRITVTEAALKFGEDAAEIPFPQGYYTLDKVAGFLFHYPNNGIVVECHTNVPLPPESSEEPEEASETGEPPQYKNAKALTAARAKIIRRYFVEVKGIPSSNVTARGAGDSKPLVEDDAANPANRRVEITINKTP